MHGYPRNRTPPSSGLRPLLPHHFVHRRCVSHAHDRDECIDSLIAFLRRRCRAATVAALPFGIHRLHPVRGRRSALFLEPPRMFACLLLPSAVSPQTAVTWSTVGSYRRPRVPSPLHVVRKPETATPPPFCPEPRAGPPSTTGGPAGSLRLRAVWVPSPCLHGRTIHCTSLAPVVCSHCRGSPRSALQVPLQRRCAVKPVARKRTEGRLDRTLSRCVIWIQGRPSPWAQPLHPLSPQDIAQNPHGPPFPRLPLDSITLIKFLADTVGRSIVFWSLTQMWVMQRPWGHHRRRWGYRRV